MSLTAVAILTIPLDEPERLFTGPGSIKSEYHALAMEWHPDRCRHPQAAAVLAHLTALRHTAEEHTACGEWHIPGLLELTSLAAKSYRIRYRKKHVFELGEMYIGRTVLAFGIRKEFADLAAPSFAFRYRHDKMRDEMARYLPVVDAKFETLTHHWLVLKKTEELILLRDLPQPVDPKHVAWIISSALNIACYLQYAELTHNDISMDTFFISPQHHSGLLLGGWWYSAPNGERLRAVPNRTLRLMPPGVLRSKEASPRVDLECIRALGRELLGDPVGTRLSCPAPMAYWLRYATSGSAFTDYKQWQATLETAFGARRFVPMPIKAETVYTGV